MSIYISLQGYVYISNPTLISKGGGVAMYIKNNITYQLYTELTVMNEKQFESIFVILKLDAVEVVCGTIYRSPIHMSSSFNIFLDSLNKSLAALKKRKSINYIMGSINYIMGDLNLNLLDTNDNLIEQFIDVMFDDGYLPLINKPTQITEKSSKTIDHIWTNAKCKPILSHVITFQVADHLVVMQSLAIGKPITKPPLPNRIFNDKNLKDFHNALRHTDFTEVMLETDTNKSFSIFYDIFSKKFDQYFPLVTNKSKRSNYKWYDNEL